MCIKAINNKKNILRKKYKIIRENKENRIKVMHDNLIINRLFSLNEYKYCKVILTYVSRPDEINTHDLILKALSDKKIVGVPRCIKKRNKIEFLRISSFNDLEPGPFDILEPIISKCMPISNLNSSLCVVPGLSFDKNCYRLGYGGGYYDRFLSSFGGKKIGLCYEKCIRYELPKDEFDARVDMVITENRIIS